MPRKPNKKQIAQLDRQADLLMQEFEEHYLEFEQTIPDADRHIVFEGWSLQKIAHLQVMVLELDRVLNALSRKVADNLPVDFYNDN